MEREAIADATVYGTRVTLPVPIVVTVYLIRRAALSASRRAASLKGLNRHADRALRQQPRTDGPVSIGGDEDNRDLLPPTDQFLLKIGARHAGHRDVENQAARFADDLGGEERFRR